MSGGLDNTVRVWDIRKFGDNRSNNEHRKPQPITSFNCGKSINSAFFSPSGQYAVATTQANKLDVFENIHLERKDVAMPADRVAHDNQTGRWLTTFMATFHPNLDLFCVGSMGRPRAIELYDATGKFMRSVSGEGLSSVASRCCFHPRKDKIIVAGGNSSGRVTIIR
jgi:WD repeat-containing protein 76